MDIKVLMKKHKVFIIYALFGLITVVVNFSVFFTAEYLFHLDVLTANTLAWIAAVICSFYTTKKHVFNNTEPGRFHFQFVSFMAVRLVTLGMVQISLTYLTGALNIHNDIAKVILSLIEVLLNYFFTKWVTFSDKAFIGYSKHMILYSSVITSILNYGTFYIVENLFDKSSYDNYMFVDMIAWLIASMYFFTVTRHLMAKNKDQHASLVYYVLCVTSFLLAHMIIRFSNGTLHWPVQYTKPATVVFTFGLCYFIMTVFFPKAKHIDTTKSENTTE